MTSTIGLAGQDMNGEGPFAPKPSITNIIGTMNEDFLPGYYAKLVAEHAVNNLGALNYSVEKFGPQLAVNALKAVPNRPNPAAAVGDEVHTAIDVLHSTGAVTQPEDFSTTTARQMFAQYRHFAAVERPEIVATEFTVWSYRYGYAGTGDLLWRWRDAFWAVDTKTGNRVYPKVAMQCAALARADVIIDAQGEELPVPEVDKIGVLHVRPRSVKLYELQHAEQAFAAFVGLKAAFDWKRSYKERTITEPLVTTEHRAS